MRVRCRILVGLVLVAAVSGVSAGDAARADGWVGPFTELRTAPAELSDERAPLAERLAFARTLGAFGPDAEVVPLLLSALQAKPPPLLRDEILLALARRAPAAAAAPLSALLASEKAPSPELGIALAAIGTDAALSALIAALPRPEAAAVAERALVRAGTQAAAPLARALAGAAPVRAAQLLGELGPVARPSAAAALERALSSRSRALRAAAAQALGRIQSVASAPALLPLLNDDAPEVVLAALSALAQVASPGQAAALAAHHARAPAAQRPFVLRALAAADPQRAAPLLARALRADAQQRAAALEVLEGERVAPSFVPLLQGLFEAELREASASALARVEDGAGVAVLVRAARRSPEAAARAARALAIALRRFGEALDEDDVDRAHAVLRALPQAERRLLLRALARDVTVLPEVRAALLAKPARLRATAASAALLLGDAELAPALLRALEREHDVEAARRMASAALELGARAPLRPLQRLLADPESAPEAMQLAAQSADDSVLGRELRVYLRRVLASRQPSRMRAAAALSLGALGEPEAMVALRAALSDASARVRLASARALGMLGGQQAALLCAVHARVERDALARRAAHEVAAQDGRAMPARARGALVLEARAFGVEPTREPPLFDVLLADGRWLRLRAHAGGELIVVDLPAGVAEVRRVD